MTEFCNRLKIKQQWGFVVYRTDYSERHEANWIKFLAAYEAFNSIGICESVAPIYIDRVLEWQNLTWMNDKALFDGATIDQLRTHFDSWLAKKTFQPTIFARPEQYFQPKLFAWPETYMFLVVDIEVLESVSRIDLQAERFTLLTGPNPFFKAVDKNGPQEQDSYPAWMKVDVLSLFGLYNEGMKLRSMRGLCPRRSNLFSEDNYPANTYVEDSSSDSGSEDLDDVLDEAEGYNAESAEGL